MLVCSGGDSDGGADGGSEGQQYQPHSHFADVRCLLLLVACCCAADVCFFHVLAGSICAVTIAFSFSNLLGSIWRLLLCRVC